MLVGGGVNQHMENSICFVVFIFESFPYTHTWLDRSCLYHQRQTAMTWVSSFSSLVPFTLIPDSIETVFTITDRQQLHGFPSSLLLFHLHSYLYLIEAVSTFTDSNDTPPVLLLLHPKPFGGLYTCILEIGYLSGYEMIIYLPSKGEIIS